MRLPIWPSDVLFGSGNLLAVGGIPPHVRVVGDARGGEQRRVLGSELARAGGVGGTAADRCRGAAQRAVARVHAVHGAQEDQRLHPGEHAPVLGSARRQLAEHQPVVAVAGLLQRGVGGVDEVAVHPRAVLDLEVARDALGGQARPVVGLVPHRPQADSREVGLVARVEPVGSRVVVAAVAGGHGLGELTELLGVRRPVEVRPAVARRAGAGGPDRRAAQQVEVRGDPLRLGLGHDRVVDPPGGGRVVGRVGGVEVLGALARGRLGRDQLPADRDPHLVGPEQAHLRERRRPG